MCRLEKVSLRQNRIISTHYVLVRSVSLRSRKSGGVGSDGLLQRLAKSRGRVSSFGGASTHAVTWEPCLLKHRRLVVGQSLSPHIRSINSYDSHVQARKDGTTASSKVCYYPAVLIHVNASPSAPIRDLLNMSQDIPFSRRDSDELATVSGLAVATSQRVHLLHQTKSLGS